VCDPERGDRGEYSDFGPGVEDGTVAECWSVKFAGVQVAFYTPRGCDFLTICPPRDLSNAEDST
jgi:hypothetical protein